MEICGRRMSLGLWYASLACATLALWLWWGLANPTSRFLFEAKAEYLFIPVFVLFSSLLCASVWVKERRSLQKFSAGKMGWLGLGLFIAGALTLSTTRLVPPLFWIQWDETALSSTASGMHWGRMNAYVAQLAVPNELPIQLVQDQRPPLFPFFVSAMHDLLGADPANAFLVNSFLLFFLLLLVFTYFHEALGPLPAFSAMALTISSPVLIWCAASGGYDLLSLVTLLGMLLGAKAFSDRPGPARFLAYLCLGVLFSYGRRESLLAFFLVTLFLVGESIYSRRKCSHLHLLAILPILLTPLAWIAIRGYEGFYGSLRSLGAETFSLDHWGRNAVAFGRAFFSLESRSAYSGGWHLLSVASLATLVIRRKRDYGHLGLAVILAVGVPLLVLFGFSFGSATQEESKRLFLPVIFVFSLAPILLLKLFPGRRAELLFLALSVGFLAWRMPVAINGRAISYEAKAALVLRGLVAEKIPDPQNALFVFEVPNYFLSTGMAAVHPRGFGEYASAIRRQTGKAELGRVYFVDIFAAGVNTPVKALAERHATQEVAYVRAPDLWISLRQLVPNTQPE